MKNIFLPLALLCCTVTSTFAQDYGRDVRRRDDNRRGNDGRETRECEIRSELLKRDNRVLTDRLLNCQGNQVDRLRVEQLTRENLDLFNRNNFLIDQVEKLKIDNARLEIEAHPDRGGRFSLSASILACGKISIAMYVQQCTALAKEFSIQATVIDQCSKITSSYSALECVRSAGSKDVNSRQIEACLGINIAMYAQQCVQVAGERRVHSDIIKACVKSSTSAFGQLECIKSM